MDLGSIQQNAFNKIKEFLTSLPVLVQYLVNYPTRVAADIYSYGFVAGSHKSSQKESIDLLHSYQEATQKLSSSLLKWKSKL